MSERLTFLRRCPAGGVSQSEMPWQALVAGPWQVLTASAGSHLVLEPAQPVEGHPHVVIKLFTTAQQAIDQFAAWGKDLGQMPTATHPGDTLASAQGRLDLALARTAYAWDHLRKECALVGVHLAPTAQPLPCQVGDQRLALESVPFVVQHRVVEARSVVDDHMRTGNIVAAQKVLADFLDLTQRMARRGIVLHRNFDENYGYLPGALSQGLVILDTGDLSHNPSVAVQRLREHTWLDSPAYDKLAHRHPTLATWLTEQSHHRFGDHPQRGTPGRRR